MWLKKLVAVSMTITLIGMNTVAAIGIFGPTKGVDIGLSQVITVSPPIVSLTATPPEVQKGLFSALKWSVTGEVDSCQASGDWKGAKTPFGSESTGRLASEGKKTYTLTCSNRGGSDKKEVSVTVVAAAPGATVAAPSSPGASPTAPAAAVYCQGATPCYGPREVAAHSGPGNCWGWNNNRVINISGFDSAFHQARSAIASIEVGSVCGQNLSAALGGGASAGGQTRNHNSSTKNNTDRNVIPYFVGYFDNSKP